MKLVKPVFYEQFSCTASQCEDTCCAGWEIGIDAHALSKYDEMEGAFSNRLNNGIDRDRRSFYQYDGACCFLNEDKLCDIYAEAGEEYLCDTCRTYPRHEEEYGHVRELSLGLSCPEVARILLFSGEDLRLLEEEFGGEAEDPDFDQELYALLCESRMVFFALAKDRARSFSVRMGLVLGLAHDLQKRIDSREFADARRVLRRYQKDEVLRYLEKKIHRIKHLGNGPLKGKRRLIRLFGRLDMINEKWENSYYDTVELLSQMTKRSYSDHFLSFERNMDLRYGNGYKVQTFLYFLYTYVCTAAYDGDLFTKVKMAAACTLMIEELTFTTWKRKRKAKKEDLIRNAYCFARNLEHYDENIEKLEQILAKQKYSLEYFLLII